MPDVPKNVPKKELPNFGGMFATPFPKAPSEETHSAIEPGGFGGRPVLLEEEFAPHYHAWKADASPANAGALLKAVDPVVRSALRTYAPRGATSPTMRSQAKMIVLDSLGRYDPSRAKLRSHLMVNLQSLQRAQAEENQIVSVPERVRLDQHKLHVATADLADRLGREPSDAELSEHTGLGAGRLKHVRQGRTGFSEGQLRGPEDEEGGGAEANVGVVDSKGGDVWARYVYQDLDPKDQFIMEHVTGMNGKAVLPKGEIARKLGLSAGAVSQRAGKIQRLLDSREELAANLF